MHSSPPILIPLISIIVSLRNIFSRKLRRLVLVMHDLYPDIARSTKSRSFLINIVVAISNRFFRISYNLYDLIIVCAPSIKDRLRELYDVPSRNVEYIPNWSLAEGESLVMPPSFAKDISVHSIFLMGTFGIVHLVEEFSDYLCKIVKTSEIKVNCFVKGSFSSLLAQKFFSFYNSFCFHPWVSPHELKALYLCVSPITFVALDASSCLCAFPSRIITALSWGSPIIFFTDDVDNNPVSKFILDNQVGFVCTSTMSSDTFLELYGDIVDNYSLFSARCLNAYSESFLAHLSI